MGQIGQVRDLVMAAQRGGLLKTAAEFAGRDHTAYYDRGADEPYTLVRLTADGETADYTQRFREVGEWIMDNGDGLCCSHRRMVDRLSSSEPTLRQATSPPLR